MSTALRVITLALLVVLVHGRSFAAEQVPIEQLITQAKTADDYAHIATYYEQAAQGVRADLHRYEVERAVAIKKTGPTHKSGATALLTANIAEAQRRAKEYEDLSKYYRAQADAGQAETSHNQ
jgi:hypothetical protein